MEKKKTYRDFLNELQKLTEKQLDQTIMIWSEDKGWYYAKIETLDEDYYFESECPFEGSVPESEIDSDVKDSYELAFKKGTVTIQLYD
jgi:hypothetical protein